MRVCVIGLGYIGLPTASLLATKGFQVLGVDVNPDIVESINQGSIHNIEPGLDRLVKLAIYSGNLKASQTPAFADVFMIVVPTPFDHDKKPDISYIRAATVAIAPYLQSNNLIILESTSPVGTTEKMQQHIQTLRPDLKELAIAYCPERVIPGNALQELINNDRIIGGLNAAATEKAKQFYAHFVEGTIIPTNACTAEMCKLTENAFRDVNIAFANELSMICDELSIDTWELIRLANCHPRVNILEPGPGVGGHCIAVDPWFMVSRSPDTAQLIRKAREVNDAKPMWVIEKIKTQAKKFINPVIACLGLSFKANIGDLRESPAKKIATTLIDQQVGKIVVCEPHLKQSNQFTLMSLSEAIECADIIVILVAHQQFQVLEQFDLSEKIVIDVKGFLKKKAHQVTKEIVHA